MANPRDEIPRPGDDARSPAGAIRFTPEFTGRKPHEMNIVARLAGRARAYTKRGSKRGF
ncbi:MAG TPA: hypothetical protein VHS31_03110 [Tepidisphaeraceae bacterium]|nr:hypothetical protein [Tepidisphaeraceae bacterium]